MTLSFSLRVTRARAGVAAVAGLLAGLAGMGVSPARAAGEAPPNVVLIFMDDLGYGDVGPFGSKVNRTPHLDRMAREGMRFTSFYAAPVCSVSRAQVITGCYGVRVSVPGVFFPAGPHGLNPEEHTVAELLKERGYATMCVGKWHLGDQPPFLPTRHGFDHYFGLPYSNDMNRRAKEGGPPVVPLLRDDKVIERVDAEGQGRLTQRYTDEAVKFLRANRERPFFLYLAHTAVHVPLHPGEKFRGRSANGRYGDWVEEADDSVGRVLDTLRELKLEGRTLVVFTSDNGPWLTRGADGGVAGPLRGGKGTTWEGGVRVPTVAWWPGRVPAGGTCDAVAGTIDFLPTFVKLAGGSVPADRKIDGKDITPLLTGKSKESPHEARYYYNGTRLQAVRSGPWKLAIAAQAEGTPKAGEAVPATLERPRLYNLDEDIGERRDVAAGRPEVVARLQGLARAMIADLGDGKPGPGVRPAGVVDKPVTLYPTEPQPDKPAKPDKPARKPAGKPAALDTLKVGDTLATEDAPQVGGRAFAIECAVAPAGKDGVILAHGGERFGYALYLKDGRAVFAVRTGAGISRVTAPESLAGAAAVGARLAGDGTMTLSLGGKVVATGQAGGLIRSQPSEDFCLGHDNGKPVDGYDGKTLFAGKVSGVKVTTMTADKAP